MSFDYSENGVAGHWESKPCYYTDAHFADNMTTENISLEDGQSVNGFRFNTIAGGRSDFMIYNFNFATYR